MATCSSRFPVKNNKVALEQSLLTSHFTSHHGFSYIISPFHTSSLTKLFNPVDISKPLSHCILSSPFFVFLSFILSRSKLRLPFRILCSKLGHKLGQSKSDIVKPCQFALSLCSSFCAQRLVFKTHFALHFTQNH